MSRFKVHLCCSAVYVVEFHSFFKAEYILLYVYHIFYVYHIIYCILFIHSSVDRILHTFIAFFYWDEE